MLVSALKKLIRAYHWLISPWLGNRCRYAPTCSEYAIQALNKHGAARGTALTVSRLCRCHPWGGEGFDPVPEKHIKRASAQNTSNKVETELDK